MPVLLPNSNDASPNNYQGKLRISSTGSKEDNIVEVVQDAAKKFRVLIVDRDSMSGELLTNVLIRTFRRGAVVILPTHLLNALSTSQIDPVVIGADLNANSATGYDIAYQVSWVHPSVGTIILLNRSSRESVMNAFRSGARGVFSRQQTMTDFVEFVENVQRGLSWAGREETSSLLKAFGNIPAPNLATESDLQTLTSRELEVVWFAAVGKTNKSIAKDLGRVDIPQRIISRTPSRNWAFRGALNCCLI